MYIILIKSKFVGFLYRLDRSLIFGKLSWIKKILKKFIRPKLPKNKDGEVLIHLGCGDQDDQRYINVDVLPFPHVHFVHDITRLTMFQNNFADLIYASHVLEHISHKHTIKTLREWGRVLKHSGILRLAVPDFDKMIKIYEEEGRDVKKIQKPLMGAQNYMENYHYSIFNETYLSDLLHEAGFVNVHRWKPDTARDYSFHDSASDLFYGKYPVSLNLEASKSTMGK